MGGKSEMRNFGGKIWKSGTTRTDGPSIHKRKILKRILEENFVPYGVDLSPPVYGPMSEFREHKEQSVSMWSVSSTVYRGIQH